MCDQCKSGNVILLDDDALQLQVAQLMLAAAGVHADVFTLPRQALEHAVRLQSPVTLLLDWNMPGTQTDRLCAEFRAMVPSLRVVGVSASRPAPDSLANFDAFLLKPLDPASLANALCACGDCARPAALPPDAPDAAALLANSLDRKIYQSFALRMPATQLDAMYAAYFADADRRMGTMEAAIAAADLSTMRQSAHALKGSSAMLGVSSVAETAALLESFSQGRPVPSCHAILLELRHRVATVQVAMQTHRPTTHSADRLPTATPTTTATATATATATIATSVLAAPAPMEGKI